MRLVYFASGSVWDLSALQEAARQGVSVAITLEMNNSLFSQEVPEQREGLCASLAQLFLLGQLHLAQEAWFVGPVTCAAQSSSCWLLCAASSWCGRPGWMPFSKVLLMSAPYAPGEPRQAYSSASQAMASALLVCLAAAVVCDERLGCRTAAGHM